MGNLEKSYTRLGLAGVVQLRQSYVAFCEHLYPTSEDIKGGAKTIK